MFDRVRRLIATKRGLVSGSFRGTRLAPILCALLVSGLVFLRTPNADGFSWKYQTQTESGVPLASIFEGSGSPAISAAELQGFYSRSRAGQTSACGSNAARKEGLLSRVW